MGSVRMITKQLLCLLLIHLLGCAGQELGSKSRVDAILSKFGFGENPVHLEQAEPSFAIETSKASIPIKKDKVSNDKKKFYPRTCHPQWPPCRPSLTQRKGC